MRSSLWVSSTTRSSACAARWRSRRRWRERTTIWAASMPAAAITSRPKPASTERSLWIRPWPWTGEIWATRSRHWAEKVRPRLTTGAAASSTPLQRRESRCERRHRDEDNMIDPIRTTGTGLPLAMVHGLFGLMPIGEQMAEALGPDHALFAIHARALAGNPHDSVESMARDYLAELRTHRPRGPYMLGGMCAGALIALEMARQLRIDGETIATLLMLEPNPVLNLNPPQRHLEPALEKAAAGQ